MTKAFPGAYGWGAQSVGGRGGAVIEVTNTNNSGVGSLRAVLTTSDPRIVVFRVAGLITLESDIMIYNPYLTIAGQTAPGGGIHIKGGAIYIRTHNMIVRYLRWRGESNSFLLLRPFDDCHDIIIDHCSMSWGEDDIIDIWKGDGAFPDMYNITIQNCLIAEPHKDHSTALLCGASIEGESDDHIPDLHHISIHHNLFVHNGHRNPRIKAEHTEVINNVVYNWHSRLGGTERASEVDWINNYFLDGPMTGNVILKHLTYSGETIYDNASLYINGNIAPNMGYPTDAIDNWGMWVDYFGGMPISLDHRRYSPLEPAPFPVPIQSAIDAYTSVLADVGANKRLNFEGAWLTNVDEIDIRLLADVVAEIGPTKPSNIIVPGTIGDIDAGIEYTDTDLDGMPDDWENLHGLDQNDAADGSADAGSNGYSNLEMFLNGKDYMSDIHVYLGIENINLNASQKQTLITELKALGPVSDPQPARLNHWRTRLDGDAAIFEALFNENNLTIDKFKQRLGSIFGVDPETIDHNTNRVDFAGYGTFIVTFSRSGIDYLRFALFGGAGAAWMESGDECRGYLKANQDEWR